MSLIEQRICRKCTKEKPVKEFKFTTVCKTCYYEDQKKYKQNNKIQREKELNAEQLCLDCNQIKLKKEFGKFRCKECQAKKHKQDVKEYNKIYKKPYIEINKKKTKEEIYAATIDKKCAKCKNIKNSSEFFIDLHCKDGLFKKCKKCAVEIARELRENQSEEKKLENKKKGIEYRSKELVKKRRNETTRKWKAENKQRRRDRRYERYHNDECFKLRLLISRGIEYRLKFGKKGNSCLKYLTFTVKELRDHLKVQFEPWMTFKNHGNYKLNEATWQVDHIIPCAYYEYTSMDDPEFKKCWSLANLRPLSAKQNLGDNKRSLESVIHLVPPEILPQWYIDKNNIQISK